MKKLMASSIQVTELKRSSKSFAFSIISKSSPSPLNFHFQFILTGKLAEAQQRNKRKTPVQLAQPSSAFQALVFEEDRQHKPGLVPLEHNMIYAKMAILVMHVMPVLGHMVVPKHGVVIKDGCLQLVAGVDCSNQLKLRLVGGLHPPLASERHDTPFHNQQDGL